MENNKVKNKVKKALPSALLFAFIALLIGLAFMPAVRFGVPIAKANAGLDGEAVRVLGCCEAYAATHDFSAQSSGSIKVKTFGLPYTVETRGTRKAEGGDFSQTSEGVSALGGAGLLKKYERGRYYIARGEYRNKKFEYGGMSELGRDEFVRSYGPPPTALTRYVTDGAVISAERVGDNAFKYALDPKCVAGYAASEAKTLISAQAPPEYSSIEFTLYFDGERALKITACEKFHIEKSGDTSCIARYTEVFSYE